MQQGVEVRHCIDRASLVSQMVKNLSAMQETWVQSLGQDSQVNKNGQYFCLDNSMDREAWQATVYRVAKSWT